jgi:hypothetical protein
MLTKIISAHEGVIPISSSMSNAFIDFSTVDCSILALVSNVMVDGEAGWSATASTPTAAGEVGRSLGTSRQRRHVGLGRGKRLRFESCRAYAPKTPAQVVNWQQTESR